MHKITVPSKHWTAHEARAVLEFLDDLRELVATAYGPQIVELCRDEHE